MNHLPKKSINIRKGASSDTEDSANTTIAMFDQMGYNGVGRLHIIN